LVNGPADGKTVAVETLPDRSPQQVVRLIATGAHVGIADEPTPDIEYVYVLTDDALDQPAYCYQPREDADA
jgi:hypothetical protein